MNSRGRIAAFVGGGVALLAGAFALVALTGDDPDSVTAGSSTTTSSTTTTSVVVETTTTVDLVPETTTSLAPRPATTTTASTAPPLPVVGATGAVLQPPSGPGSANRKMDGDSCESLGDEGWTVSGCGFAAVKGGGRVVWLVEARLTSGTRVYVFGPSGTAWKALLEARDDAGTRWKSVEARVVDLSGDKAEDVVVGFRAASGDGLAMDVVEGSAAVTAHRDLAAGRSRVSPGQWDTWASLSGGRYQHDVIRWQDDAWRIVLRTEEPASSVPPSQF